MEGKLETKFETILIVFVPNGSAQVKLIDFRYTSSMRKRYTRT